MDLEQEPRPVGDAASEMDRCDRAALEHSAYEYLVGRGHLNRLARLNDLNALALIRHDVGHRDPPDSLAMALGWSAAGASGRGFGAGGKIE